jgi:hypothetical protein
MTTILLVDAVEGQVEATELLDAWIVLTTERTMFSSDEVLDFCLDLRQLITPVTDTATPEAPEPELVGV